eukprot:PhF_6_TR11274/c0_g1_i1/m.18198
MMYFPRSHCLLLSGCCRNHLCRFCAEDIGWDGESKDLPGVCPYCCSNSPVMQWMDGEGPVRSYQNSPGMNVMYRSPTPDKLNISSSSSARRTVSPVKPGDSFEDLKRKMKPMKHSIPPPVLLSKSGGSHARAISPPRAAWSCCSANSSQNVQKLNSSIARQQPVPRSTTSITTSTTTNYGGRRRVVQPLIERETPRSASRLSNVSSSTTDSRVSCCIM